MFVFFRRLFYSCHDLSHIAVNNRPLAVQIRKLNSAKQEWYGSGPSQFTQCFSCGYLERMSMTADRLGTLVSL